mmetsp:Transcript_53073/g.123713  ORF Transcript_53073/g.123713 Transcript_53073/m.123713 type:complete len:233 (+) Transcript_53073:47-745(+)
MPRITETHLKKRKKPEIGNTCGDDEGVQVIPQEGIVLSRGVPEELESTLQPEFGQQLHKEEKHKSLLEPPPPATLDLCFETHDDGIQRNHDGSDALKPRMVHPRKGIWGEKGHRAEDPQQSQGPQHSQRRDLISLHRHENLLPDAHGHDHQVCVVPDRLHPCSAEELPAEVPYSEHHLQNVECQDDKLRLLQEVIVAVHKLLVGSDDVPGDDRSDRKLEPVGLHELQRAHAL